MKKFRASIAFNFLSIGFFIVVGCLAVFGKGMSDGSLWVLLASAAICALIANLDKIESFQASLSGFKAKMREADLLVDEAKSTLAELHKFAEMTGTMLITMLSGEGRLGGWTSKDIEIEKTRILESLKSIGLDDEAMKKVSVADRKWVAYDYSIGIMKRLQKSTLCSPEQCQVGTDMLELWNSDENYHPTPYNFEESMKRHRITDPEVLELIKDYKHYIKNDEHRRPNVWKDKEAWLFN